MLLLQKSPEDTYKGCCPFHENCVEGLASGPAIMGRYGKPAKQLADSRAADPVSLAAARAVSTACSTAQTPTNAFGFLLYGAAARAYHSAGLSEAAATYDRLAEKELKRALLSLQAAAVSDEPNPVSIRWNC